MTVFIFPYSVAKRLRGPVVVPGAGSTTCDGNGGNTADEALELVVGGNTAGDAN